MTGLILGSPEAQRFWRAYPRMRTLPAWEVEAQGSLAYLNCFQSVMDNAQLAVISRRDTFELMEVHTNVKI